MTEGKNQSLGELEESYRVRIQKLTDQRTELANQLAACDQEMRGYQEKLHWVQTLIVSPHGQRVPRRKRRRKSPVKLLTYQVLSKRPGEWLTARQIFSLIRKDTHKRPSRQSINVNLNLLEKDGKVRRRPAPKGSGGAQYVYSVVAE